MAKVFQLNAAERQGTNGAVRQAGNVPAVLYGHGIENNSIQVDGKEFGKIFAEAGRTSLVTLKVGKTDHSVLIRDVQLHPVRSFVQHVDFYQVRLDEKVTAAIPLQFVGEAPAVKDKSGILVRNADTINVEAFPQDLPHEIEVPIDGLTEFDEAIAINDITIPEGITVLDDEERVLAVVQAPRTQEEIESLSEEVTEDVEGVEGVTKEEDDEAAADGEAPADEASADEGDSAETKE